MDERVDLARVGLGQELFHLALGRGTAERLLDPAHEEHESEQDEREPEHEQANHDVAIVPAANADGPQPARRTNWLVVGAG